MDSLQISVVDYRMDPSHNRLQLCLSQPRDYFTSIANCQQSRFQFIYSTACKTALMDTRVPGKVLLEWNVNDSKEHQFLLQSLDLKNGTIKDGNFMFCSHGRHNGEVLLYNYSQNENRAPNAIQIRKVPSFYTHDYFSKPSIDLYPPMATLETLSYQMFFKEHEHNPSFPTLEGVAVLPHDSGSKFTVIQLASNGSVLAQGFSYDGNQDEEEITPNLEEIENKVKDLYIQLNNQDFPRELEASHKIYDFRSVIKGVIWLI